MAGTAQVEVKLKAALEEVESSKEQILGVVTILKAQIQKNLRGSKSLRVPLPWQSLYLASFG